jgi:acyl-CoA thioesterase-1
MSVLRLLRPALAIAGLTVAAALAAGCGGSTTPGPRADSTAAEEFVEPGQLPSADKHVIAVLGDSLTAGLGLLTEESFPSRIQALFAAEGYHEVEVMNAGVSGDTTAGGLRRAPSLVAPNVRIVVVALGGNDALRGLSAAETKQNLKLIIDGLLRSDVGVLLAGMEAPTNLGDDYREQFRNAFTSLGEEYRGRIRFVPFLLEGVAANPSLNQDDGIHPNAEGARIIAELLYPSLRDMIDQLPVSQ